jgi:GNAT superfamily N-acetyltransferase
MIAVAAIAYIDVKDQTALLAEYAAECSVPAVGQPNPQWEMYERMQAAGLMQAFAVYVDGAMVGFAGVLVTVLPHYGFRAATVESLFVASAHRSSGAGTRLMAAIEKYARTAGCRLILYGAPAGGQLEALLGKRYTRTSSMYCKPLT